MELTWQGQRRKHGVLWVPTVTTQIATNALATPLPPPHILAWRKGCDHDAAFARTNEAVWHFESGIFFTFFFFLYSFRNFFTSQCNDLNLLFYICARSKHVRLRKRPITNQIFLPPWPLAVLSRIRVIRENAPIQLKWPPTGLIMSEIKTLKTEGTIKHKKTLEMHSQYSPLEMLTTCSLFLQLNINVSKGWGRKWRRFFLLQGGIINSSLIKCKWNCLGFSNIKKIV